MASRTSTLILALCALLMGLVLCSGPIQARESLVRLQSTEADVAQWEAAWALTGGKPAQWVAPDGETVSLDAENPARALTLRRAGAPDVRVELPEPLTDAVVGRSGPTSLLVAGLTGTGAERRLLVASYHRFTERWQVLGRLVPAGEQVRLVCSGADILERVDAGGVRRHRMEVPTPPVRALDVTVVVLYLAAMLGIGLWCARGGTTSTADYFLADRELNWFVGGVTLYATATSAISFVSVPAKSFATNWQYMAYNYVTLVGTTIAAIVLIPRLRRMNLVSVYEYLETRFHPSLRAFSSGVTILYNLVGKQAVVILLPALVMQQMLGLPPVVGVVVIGVLTTLYTMVGGFRAVVWTDLAQCFIMLGGAAVGAWWICHALGTDLLGMYREASALGKTKTFSLDFNLLQPTLWAFLFLEIFNILTWPKDQMLMQRVFATRNEAHARGSVIFMAALVIPGATLFFTIGSALFLFYRAHPERFVPTLPNDSVFPLFIAWEMPSGLSGLLIAAILAASMSTLSSGISSLATLVKVDFFDRFPVFSGLRDRISNRALVLLIGTLATASGAAVSLIDVGSLLDFGMQAFAIFGGGFAAAYGLGLFTRRARWEGVLIGTAVSAVASFFLVKMVSPILMQATTIGISLVVGYLASLIVGVMRPSSR